MILLVIMTLNGDIVKNYTVPEQISCELVEKTTNEAFKGQKAKFKAECFKREGQMLVRL